MLSQINHSHEKLKIEGSIKNFNSLKTNELKVQRIFLLPQLGAPFICGMENSAHAWELGTICALTSC